MRFINPRIPKERRKAVFIASMGGFKIEVIQ